MLLKSKTVQLSKFIVKDYVSCEFNVETTFEHQRAFEKATERAMILQEINSRHSSFLTVNQENNTSMSPEAKSCAVRAQP